MDKGREPPPFGAAAMANSLLFSLPWRSRHSLGIALTLLGTGGPLG